MSTQPTDGTAAVSGRGTWKKQNKLDKIIADFIDSEESNEVLKKVIKSTIEKLQIEIDELEYKYRIALKSSSTLDVLNGIS